MSIPTRDEFERIREFLASLKRHNISVSGLKIGDFALQTEDADLAKKVMGAKASGDSERPGTMREAIANARQK